MKDKIADIIYNEFSYVYCYNCRNVECEDICDYCNRKSMGWEVSRATAEDLANKIIELMEQNNE